METICSYIPKCMRDRAWGLIPNEARSLFNNRHKIPALIQMMQMLPDPVEATNAGG